MGGVKHKSCHTVTLSFVLHAGVGVCHGVEGMHLLAAEPQMCKVLHRHVLDTNQALG